MTTAAIIGAGPGLGRAAATQYAAGGFTVALLSRSRQRVEQLATDLRQDGVDAHGYVADVRDGSSITDALSRAGEDLGPIELLQYSPLPAKEYMRPVLETTAEDLRGPIEFAVFGPVTAARQVLPGMRALGRGTLLFVNGASAVRAADNVTGTSVAFAAESAWARLLHDAVRADGVHVGQLIVPFGIDDGDPAHSADAVAKLLWQIHTDRSGFRSYAAALDS